MRKTLSDLDALLDLYYILSLIGFFVGVSLSWGAGFALCAVAFLAHEIAAGFPLVLWVLDRIEGVLLWWLFHRAAGKDACP